MAANTVPVYSKSGDLSNNAGTGMNQPITAAANDYSGISGNNSLIFTAGTNGNFIQGIKLKAAGSCVASVMRFYLNNGSTVGTATNNQFIGEISTPITTAIATAATAELWYPLNLAIPTGFKIYAGLGTAVSAGWVCTVVAGVY